MRKALIFEQYEIASDIDPATARTALARLLKDGFEVDGERYALFGLVRGDRFTMSFGVPLLSSSAVLRGRIDARGAGTVVRALAGGRIWTLGMLAFGLLFTFGFGGYQVARELTAATGTLGDHLHGAVDVLPRMLFLLLVISCWGVYLRVKASLGGPMLAAAVRSALGTEARDPLPLS